RYGAPRFWGAGAPLMFAKLGGSLMGRALQSRIVLLALAVALILVFALLSARSVARWRDLRTVDRIVETHRLPEAVDFALSRFEADHRDQWRVCRKLGLSILRQGLDEHDPYEQCYAATSLVSYGDWSGRTVIDSSLRAKDLLLQKAAIEGLAEA